MLRLCVGAFGVAFALCLLLVCVCLFDDVFARRCYCFFFVLLLVLLLRSLLLFVGGIGVCIFVICVVVIFCVVVLVRVVVLVLLKRL